MAAKVGFRENLVASALPGPPSERGPRRLVAEDALDNRLLLEAFLDGSPHRASFAENGLQAVELFCRQTFDLVLMDVQRPEMDGFSATRAMRAWKRRQGRSPTPIIALTAHALHEDVEKALAAGCDAHLAKPIKKRLLLETLARHAASAV